jgi:hypothetical protein
MNAEEHNAIETQRQALLGQLTAAETALRNGLHTTRGFGEIARAHMERARAHIQEAFIAINEAKSVRSVQQLVDDLNRIQQVMENTRHGRSQRI